MAKDANIEVTTSQDRLGPIVPVRIGTGLLELDDLTTDKQQNDPWSSWWLSFLRGAPLPNAKHAKKLRCVDLFCGSGGFSLGVSLAARGIGRRAWLERIVDADGRGLDVVSRSLDVGSAINAGVSSLVDYQVRQRGAGSKFTYPPEIVDPKFAIEPDIDILIAGPPCQGHSNLNNHTRRADPRNDLFICTVAAAVALRSKIVLIENVRTVTASHGDVVGMAKELFEDSEYEVFEDFVRADDLGWPQTRERYFMTAIRRDVLQQAPPEIRRRETRNVLWAIEDLMDQEAAQEPFGTSPVPTAETKRRIDWLFDNNQYNLANSERPDCHKEGTTYTAVYGRMFPDRPAPTITTGIGTPGQGRFIHPLRRRLVTPNEAARIQGFPDGYAFVSKDSPAKRKDLAKWIGDAVPAPMGYEMARRALIAIGMTSEDHDLP